MTLQPVASPLLTTSYFIIINMTMLDFFSLHVSDSATCNSVSYVSGHKYIYKIRIDKYKALFDRAGLSMSRARPSLVLIGLDLGSIHGHGLYLLVRFSNK